MRRFILFIAMSIVTFFVFAQTPESFKYQAVIRDNVGQLIASQLITVRISIHQTTETGTVVFQESFTETTTEHGLISINIGQGSLLSGNFSTIDWASDVYFLQTEIDLGSGYEDLGTTQLLSVPYALFSAGTVETDPIFGASAASGISSTDINTWNSFSSPWSIGSSLIYYNGGNVGIGTNTPTGLLHLNGPNTGEGNVLFQGVYKGTPGDPPISGGGTRMMWYPDKASFRSGRVTGTQWDKDSIGNYSFATGENVKAKGANSMAWGQTTSATGLRSTAWGASTVASGDRSTAWGQGNTASGNMSTSFGEGNTATSYAEVMFGRFGTTYTMSGTGAANWATTDRLFSIGNGTGSGSRSNALTLLKNGNLGLGVDDPEGYRLYVNSAGSGSTNATVFVENSASNGVALKVNTATTEGSVLVTQDGTGYALRCDYMTPFRTVFIVAGDNVGIGLANPDQRLVVYNGTTTGKYTTTGWTHSSDVRLKKNILDLEPTLEKLLLLEPKRYDFKTEESNNSVHIGLIAQEVELLFPEFVFTGADGMKSIAYGEMVPVLIQSLKEQQNQIDQLMQMIFEQQQRIELLENSK